MTDPLPERAIAIIGMAGRFPGAPTVGMLWQNLLAGVESITRFEPAALEDSFDAATRALPNFVAAKPVLDGVDQFDAPFFGMMPREAALTDPQQRLLLECAWEALEDAGYDPAAPGQCIGVFAGATSSTYLLQNLLHDRSAIAGYTSGFQIGNLPMLVGSAADFTATRIGYKLGLTGPCVAVQSACSTSLLAVAQAVQNLLCHGCDMALAGGVSITFPQRRGYLAQEGGIVSTDGHCRPFDAGASGTIFGSGAGLVVLKRLEDAVADRDQIYAVIRGVGVNNDGAGKVGFTAPSVDGQAAAIAMAHAAADIDARSIGYVECHGTGTPMGDPIEVAGLTAAFRLTTEDRGFCALGSVKSNIGHLDAAAGVTGLIKTALSVKSGILPASLHVTRPNPALELPESPFFIADHRQEWPGHEGPRRAGVSAFGFGGTNVHLVLEQAPASQTVAPARRNQVLTLSARSAAALGKARDRLAEHLEAQPEQSLADIAFTLQTGRRPFPYRLAVAAGSHAEAAAALHKQNTERATAVTGVGDLVFMFPGQGSQYPQMARELYAGEPVFRRTVDLCCELLKPELGLDLRGLLYPSNGGDPERLSATLLAQPAIFTVEYALAQLLLSWGLQPAAMIGHSVGEFAAACLAGVFSLEDALSLVARRGRMMQELPGGAMLAVRLPDAEIAALAQGGVSLAAINAPGMGVLAGPFEAIEALEAELAQRSVTHRRLQTSHAFHSAMIDPLVAPFTESVAAIRLNAPELPYISGVTGDWASAEQTTDPSYWARHAREPVRFADGIATLARSLSPILLEVGPGAALASFALQGAGAGRAAISCLPDAQGDAEAMLATALGRLWTAGTAPDWSACQAGDRPRRVSLPTYPFERSRHWVEAPVASAAVSVAAPAVAPVQPLPTQPEQEPAMPPHADTDIPLGRSELGGRIAAIFENLSGRPFGADETGASFLELGFDSLLLTQAAQGLQTTFGVQIRFRQLLDDLPSVDDVTRHIAELCPQEMAKPAPVVQAAAPAAPAPAMSAPVTSVPAAASAQPAGSGLDALMREQLDVMSRLMERQLQALSGQAAAPAIAAAVPALQPSPAPLQPAAVQRQLAPAPSASTSTTTGSTARFKPLIRTGNESLSEAQRAHVARLTKLYVGRTATSKRLADQHRPVLADPRTVSGFAADWKEMVYPIVSARAKGARIWDVDGNTYIDLVNGYGQTAFGHAPDFVVEAVQAQLTDGFAIGPQSPLAHEASRLFCELTGHARVAFCNTGSEAVMAAMRVARTITGRDRIVAFSGAYHGQFDEVLVRGVGEQHRSVPAAPGIPADAVGRMTILDYGTDESLAWLREHAQELAAVLVEPVQSRRPGYLPVAFLKEVRAITEQAGTALVLDEVVTGFRVHPAGVQALLGIKPDLATYGKVVGGGLPVGLLAGTPRFMDALDGGAWRFGDDSVPEVGVTFFAGTFVRHPLVLAATVAVLRHLKEKGPALTEALTQRMQGLVEALRRAFAKVGWDVPIESYGSVAYFEPGRDHRLGSLLHYHLRARGIFIQEHYPCFLTTQHGDAEIAAIIAAFEDSLALMRRDGMLPGTAAESLPPDMPAAPSEIELPLTEAQTEIWLSDQTGPEASAAFNESVSLTLDGHIDALRLAETVRQVAARHAILHARFSADGETMQLPPSGTFPVAISDLRGEPDPQAALQALIEGYASRPYDLVQGPVAEAEIIRLGEQKHVLILSAHHIVCDGWSTNILLDEIATAYRSGVDGLPAAMPFADYATETRQDPRTEEAATYWTKTFAELPTPLELPTDRQRQAPRSFNGGTRTSFIEVELYRQVKAAGAKRRRTLFATLFASFQVLLLRLSGQRDLVIGVPAAGQSQLEGPSPVGHCVNFLPIRGGIDPAEPFSAHLDKVGRLILDAYDHQSFTLGALLKRLRVPPVSGRLPLVEVQFNLERLAGNLDFGAGVKASAEPNPKAFSTFDLYFNIGESDDGLRIDCCYGADLFDAATIDRWLGHYRTLLAAFVANPDMVIAAMPLIEGDERQRLVSEINDTQVALQSDDGTIQAFERQVQQQPEAIAVSCGDQQLSYAALNAWADRIAAELTARVDVPESRIGLLLERSPALIAGMLGALKAGFPYVPLDPVMPKARIQRILRDSEAVALLTAGPLDPAIVEPDESVMLIDVDRTTANLAGIRVAAIAPDQLAYVIYTSGSTGAPKGVEVSHGGLSNLLFAMAREPGFSRSDTMLAVTTVTFDIAALELLLPLIQGGRVAIATSDEAKDGAELLARLQQSGANVLQATPMTWRLLLEAGFRSRPGLRMLCGGEALPLDLARKLLEGGGELWNMYGPTETTIWSSVARIQPEDEIVTIGLPIANTQFYVVDANNEPVGVGIPGELLIAGTGLARGYANNPKLTARSFIANPVDPGTSAKAYRTGDRAKYLPDGRIVHLGRLDHQVKLRGFRIEPGEIEAVLARKTGIVSAVILREDVPGEPRLVCYYVTGADSPPPSELRAALAQDLPDYMVPTAWVGLPALPLNSSGKLDRAALPAPDAQSPAPKAEKTADKAAPRTPVEDTLIRIWSEVLRREDIDVHDDLFDLGADSLSIFQITSRARREGLKVAARDFFRNRTIAAVAAALPDEPAAEAAAPAATFWKRPWRRPRDGAQQPNEPSAASQRERG
ncbi:non-ribosomal peptide synthetase/type I polyketide synthase [Bosea sp. (in: a-proteobacteria)]|jgi:amino acid adenylation domain-containing protein|uniref:non-ribosomal peptide synthetase/type I polyketide synthase n=1 Tax=Bosea sp. (in: a-proteobacteria) TaxID=1871050 RepID=UPI002DDD465A|nr:non-ribosomal peptide synthetase/type I polyketide synthase [Bosea sp. (in: a-proteobacteria)]HEV2509945.1 amino acid adenylation domain-containing protein [Bosea sp. (in: a-proteobacteria)]